MKALLLALALFGSSQEPPPRLRTTLPGGTIVLAERLPGAKALSVQLFVSTRTPEALEAHGVRHMLEHILAKGPKKDLDVRLEASGMFLLAKTMRDGIQFEIVCKPGQLDLAIDALALMIKPVDTTPEEIAREAGLIEEEISLQSDAVKLGAAAWRAAYGNDGLDPLGSPVSLRAATPRSLREAQAGLFASDALILVIVGDVDPAVATARARKVFSNAAGTKATARTARPPGTPGRTEAQGASGEARAALVPGFKDIRAMSTLAAALAVAAQFDSPFVTYTPTTQNGLVIVGRTDENSGIGLKIDALDAADEAALFPLGKLMASQWVARLLSSPSGIGFLRGLLLAQGEANKPELMLETIAQMTLEDFSAGMKRLRKEQAMVVVGVKG